MMSSGQRVSTKYGPGDVVWVSRVSSNVYVRLQARAGALYIFSQGDLCLGESDQPADQPVLVTSQSLYDNGGQRAEAGAGLDDGPYQFSTPADQPASHQSEGID